MGVFDALRQSASAADIRILHVDFRDCNDENNESLVVYVRHAGRSFLFAGDAEWEDRDCTPAIQNMLARFTGSSRQTEGFLRSRLTLLNLDNDVPDHSTISRRKARLGQVASYERRTVKPVHLRIDSSGLSVHVGQWRTPPKARDSRKLHLAVDEQTSDVVACALTSKRARDASRVASLVGQIERTRCGAWRSHQPAHPLLGRSFAQAHRLAKADAARPATSIRRWRITVLIDRRRC